MVNDAACFAKSENICKDFTTCDTIGVAIQRVSLFFIARVCVSTVSIYQKMNGVVLSIGTSRALIRLWMKAGHRNIFMKPRVLAVDLRLLLT